MNAYQMTIRLTNISDQPRTIYNPDTVYLGGYILLVSEAGEVMEPVRTVKYKLRARSKEEAWPKLLPSESFEITFLAEVSAYPDSKNPKYRDHLWFGSWDYKHKLTTTGRFKVYARARYSERVVSEPVEIELSEPEPVVDERENGSSRSGLVE